MVPRLADAWFSFVLFVLHFLDLILISFSVTWLAIKWIKIDKKYAYGIAGAIALFFIVFLMPVVFFGVDMLAGARTPLGKVSLIICGYVGGHFMGSKLNKIKL